jgi:acid phosphatase
MTNLSWILSLLSVFSFAWATPAPRLLPFHKALIVIFENTSYADAVKQPFMASLAKKGALLSNVHAEAHPSLPNYIALTSGETWGVKSDDDVTLNVRHIGNLLDEAHKSWKVYAEGYPGKPGRCFLGSYANAYARKHVPFLSYADVQKTPLLCEKIVSAAEFPKDVLEKSLPDFALYIPDLRNDAHNTNARYADLWFKKTFDPLLTKLLKDELLIVTFDEDGAYNSKTHGYNKSSNRVFTALYGGGVRPGTISNKRYDHYSILKTVEAGLHLKSLGVKDKSARLISDVWK